MKRVLALFLLFTIEARGLNCTSFLLKSFEFDSITVRDNPVSFDPVALENTLESLLASWGTGFQRDLLFKETGEIIDPSASKGPRPRPLEVFSSLKQLRDLVREFYYERRGFYPDMINLSIRATSNDQGFAVRPGRNADERGLHNHLPLDQRLPVRYDSIDFVLALKGPGPRVLLDGRVLETLENQLVLMGIEALHGSPDSQSTRLVIVGSAFALEQKRPGVLSRVLGATKLF